VNTTNGAKEKKMIHFSQLGEWRGEETMDNISESLVTERVKNIEYIQP
jgi:hypothetical protein